jgi:hypothetical protein
LKNNKNSLQLGYFYQLNILEDACGMEANTNPRASKPQPMEFFFLVRQAPPS